MSSHCLQNGLATATIATQGAELQALGLGGLELLWGAGPLWPRHAPLLFPIVGTLRDNRLRHRGATTSLGRHGFARDRAFTWAERSSTSCTLVLEDDAETRAAYPFAFQLRVTYTLAPTALRLDLELHNPGPDPLPASLGLHPAFRWPLVPGLPKEAHRLIFEQAEPGPCHRLDAAGLLDPRPLPTPIQGHTLPLTEALFTQDALVFLGPRGRGLRYEAEGGPALTFTWEGFPHLGLWAKPDPGAAFLCIEPWQGYADPEGWAGEFSEKPGSFRVEPGDTRVWSFSASV